MLYLLSCHAFKDSEIYKDIILGPGNLKKSASHLRKESKIPI